MKRVSQGGITRRDALKLGAATAVAGAALAMARPAEIEAAPNDARRDDVGRTFAIDIPGAPNASKNIREIAIDELNVDIREMTTGLDVEYRIYGPGAAHWGTASFTSAVTLGGSKELKAWWDECAQGKNIRKNITVTLFKSDKSTGRSYTLMDCFPTQWTSVNFDTSATVQTETVRVKVGRIEFKT